MQEIREKIEFLNKHTQLYEANTPKITDKEWDAIYFELQELERKTGIIYPDSPTQKIHYEVVNSLKKVIHNHLMLSLEKTKDVSEVLDFIDNKSFVIMPKMDGLTCSLRYVNGELVGAETRGDGRIGEDILHNAKVLNNIPQKISYKEELVIDGEIVCTKQAFKQFESEYSNPRNFAAGSIRLLDNKECAKRKLQFVAWDVIKGFKENTCFNEHLQNLKSLGFTVVPWQVEGENFTSERFENLREQMIAESANYPIDGLVIKFDNIEYGKTLGRTDHHFNNAIAFKFADETYETELLDIEWTMGRTGQISPVALFETINIDGTDISRASLSNLSIMKQTLGDKPFKGQIIEVSKRNQIIPKIERAKDENGQWITI